MPSAPQLFHVRSQAGKLGFLYSCSDYPSSVPKDIWGFKDTVENKHVVSRHSHIFFKPLISLGSFLAWLSRLFWFQCFTLYLFLGITIGRISQQSMALNPTSPVLFLVRMPGSCRDCKFLVRPRDPDVTILKVLHSLSTNWTICLSDSALCKDAGTSGWPSNLPWGSNRFQPLVLKLPSPRLYN